VCQFTKSANSINFLETNVLKSLQLLIRPCSVLIKRILKIFEFYKNMRNFTIFGLLSVQYFFSVSGVSIRTKIKVIFIAFSDLQLVRIKIYHIITFKHGLHFA